MGYHVYPTGLAMFNNIAKKFLVIALEHLTNHVTIMRIFFLYFLVICLKFFMLILNYFIKKLMIVDI